LLPVLILHQTPSSKISKIHLGSRVASRIPHPTPPDQFLPKSNPTLPPYNSMYSRSLPVVVCEEAKPVSHVPITQENQNQLALHAKSSKCKNYYMMFNYNRTPKYHYILQCSIPPNRQSLPSEIAAPLLRPTSCQVM
jgi:hypothetical protein